MALTIKTLAASKVRIGTLLLRAGVVKPEAFADALERSKQTETPIGTVLLKGGHITQEALYAALYLQSLVGEGVLALETAVKAMHMCNTQGAQAAAALSALGWRPVVQPQVDEIEYLMIESGFVTKQAYYSVVAQTRTAFSLVLKGAIYCNQFNEILKAVSLVRVGVCTLEQANAALKEYRKSNRPVEQALTEMGINVQRTNLRLGDMLVAASLLSEAEMLLALEKSLRNNQRLGQYLTAQTRVTAEILDLCLQVQGLAATGVVAAETAVRIVKDCTNEGIALADYLRRTEALAEDSARSAFLVRILKEAGFITESDVRQALHMTRDYQMGPIAALTASKHIEPHIYHALWYCDGLVQRGLLRADEVVLAILWCQRTGGTADEAIQHVSGKFTGLSTAVQQAIEELTPLQKLNNEREQLFKEAEDEKNSLHAMCFIAGLVVFVAATLISAWLLPASTVFYCLCAASTIYAGYLFVLGFSRKQQLEEDRETLSLAATTAVRRATK